MTDGPAPTGADASGDRPGADAIEGWEDTAPEWERHRDRVFEGFRHVSDWLINQVDPQPGQTILEVAAGPGETGFLAAEALGQTGRLISTDLSPSMVDAARRGRKRKTSTTSNAASWTPRTSTSPTTALTVSSPVWD